MDGIHLTLTLWISGYEDQGQMLANQWNDIMVLD